MTSRGTLGAGAVAAALVVVAAWWLLRDDGAGAGGGAVIAPPARVGEAAPALSAGASVAPAAPVVAEDGAGAESALSDDSPPEVDEAKPVARITGRVVDEFGAPIPGATVFGVPTATVLGPGVTRTELDVAALPLTRTGPDGTFALALPVAGFTAVRPPVPGRRLLEIGTMFGKDAKDWPETPEVVVQSPGRGTRAVPCHGFDGAAYDVGVVALSPGGVLEGRVVDEHGRALPGVVVAAPVRSLEPAADGRIYQGTIESFLKTETDHDGGFVVAGLPACRTGYLVATPGFVPVAAYDIDLPLGARSDAGDVVLRRGASIAGVVTDAEGDAVAGALVLASARDWSRSFIGFQPDDSLQFEVQSAAAERDVARARSGPDGHFVVSGLDASVLTVYVVADGFEPARHARVDAGASRLHVALQRPAVLVLSLVDDADDTVISEAEWEVRRDRYADDPSAGIEELDRDDWPKGLEAPDGAIVIAGIGPGGNAMTVAARGYARKRFTVPGVSAPGVARYTARLVREARLRARLVAGDGTPVSGALVEAEARGDARDRPLAVSAPDGSVEFSGLAAAEWRLEVGDDRPVPGFVPYVGPWTALASGEEIDFGDIVLERAGAIVGIVLDADGAPVVGEEVGVFEERQDLAPVDGSGLWWGALVGDEHRTDAAGRFRFDSLAPNEYRVSLGRKGGATCIVRAGEATEVVIRNHPSPVVTGRVTAGDVPLADVRVFLREDDDRNLHGDEITRRTTFTDAFGEYRIASALPGTRLLSIDVPSGPRIVERIEMDWGDVVVRDHDFGSGEVAGVVRQVSDGEPVADALISLTHESGALEARSTADANGNFRVRYLAPGSWSLSARATGLAPAQAGPWRFGPGERIGDIVVAMEPGAAIEGRLVSTDDRPLPNWLAVSLIDAEGAAFIERKRVEDDDAFRLDGLPAGDWVLVVIGYWADDDRKGMREHEVPVRLAPGETKSVTITLD